jgi:hypothetical protein
MRVRANVRTLVLVVAVTALLTGCTSTPAASSPTSATDPIAQITANWEEFFNPKTANDRRVQLLENGPAFAATLEAQSSNALTASTSPKVSKVVLTSPTEAAVTYSILLNGQPILIDQKGTAVLDGGTWKVSSASFCVLLKLELGGSTSGLPAPCTTGPSALPSPSASSSSSPSASPSPHAS